MNSISTSACVLAPVWLKRLQSLTGLDRAITYTVGGRSLQILGSTGTVLLIVHFFTPVEQGYYYTLLSLVALQTIFELGFSFVILQMAAHESVHLSFLPDGSIEGDAVAHERLASVLQKTMRWYLVAAVLMVLILTPFGFVFFSRHSQGAAEVTWRGPWFVAVFATAALFFVNPIFSFLEGCGQVRQVAGMRFAQGIAAVLVPWTVLLSRRGLYAPGAVNASYCAVGLIFLWPRRRVLLSLLRHQQNGNSVAWRTEIWPFQWQIAVSFLCSYFTIQVFTPILFAYRGAIEAGRMGISMSVAGYIWAVVFGWMSTKATPFGKLVSRGAYGELDRLFFRTLRQSLAVLLGVALIAFAGLSAIQANWPQLGARMLPMHLFALLLVGAVGTYLVQSFAVYLRAHKSEPFLFQSMAVAGLTSISALLIIPRWGFTGAAASYLLCMGLIAPCSATLIFQRKRREHALECSPC